MTHALHGEVIVPEILNRPLHRIAYLDLVRKILVANPAKILDLFVLHDLWDAILSKVYDYEFDWREDKKAEVGSPGIFVEESQLLAQLWCRGKLRTFINISRLLQMLLNRKSENAPKSRKSRMIRRFHWPR